MAPQLRARTTRSQLRALAYQDEKPALGSLAPVDGVKRSDTSQQAPASRGSVIADAGIGVENSATSSTTGKAKNTTKHRKRRGTRTVDRRTRLAARSKWRARLHIAERFTTYEPLLEGAVRAVTGAGDPPIPPVFIGLPGLGNLFNLASSLASIPPHLLITLQQR